MNFCKDSRVVRTLLKPVGVIRYLVYCGLLTVMLISAAQAACTSPAGNAGDLIFNDNHNTLQYCNGTQWIAIAGTGGSMPTGCSTIGDECSDGSVYAGISPDGSVAMYTTHCDAGMTWNGSVCTGARSTFAYNNGNASGDTLANTGSTTDGDGNTALLLSTDADSITGGTQPHQAAQYCGNLTDLGHTNWYLPAKDELAVLRTNRVAIGGFELNAGASGEQRRLWSSSEDSQFIAWRQNMPDGVQGNPVKDEINTARCVRTVPASTGCTSPAGSKGDIIYNADHAVMQYCDAADNWRSMGPIGGPPGASCDTTPQTFTTPGSASFSVPAGCGSVTVEAWGAGGAGSLDSLGQRGAGGGGGASAVVKNAGSVLLVVGGGGGGGGGIDAAPETVSRGGGGGYASATATVTSGEQLDVYVGGGGSPASLDTGGNGGVSGTYAGGKGGNRRQNGGGMTYGGGGGGGNENTGGNSTYGGAGGAGGEGGSCGTSTNGGACSTTYGGGGGGYSISGGTVTLGSNGTTGTAANSGPGNGVNGNNTGGPGKVVITPSGGGGGGGDCTNPVGDEGDLIFSSTTNTLQYCAGAWVTIGE